jgi:hypothetical protein
VAVRQSSVTSTTDAHPAVLFVMRRRCDELQTIATGHRGVVFPASRRSYRCGVRSNVLARLQCITGDAKATPLTLEHRFDRRSGAVRSRAAAAGN